jgi:hypothetical protein
MNASALLRCAFGLGLAAAGQGGVGAQPLNGPLGPESRSSIRISVSVAPKFNVDGPASLAPKVPSWQDSPRMLRLSSNAPGLRFNLVAAPWATKKPAEPRLFLIVPD